MPLVSPEYGPSLPELAGPRVRALPSVVRLPLIAGVAVLAVAAGIVIARDSGRGLHDVLVRKPIAFTLAYKTGLHKVAPQGDEVLRLETTPGVGTQQIFTARPLHLGSYTGDVTADMLSIASARLADLSKADTDFAYRGEGKARINFFPAYQLSFQTRRDGRFYFGKRFFLAPASDSNKHPTDGIELELLTQPSKAVTGAAAVGTTGQLKTPLRSFRFGTSRP